MEFAIDLILNVKGLILITDYVVRRKLSEDRFPLLFEKNGIQYSFLAEIGTAGLHDFGCFFRQYF